jgi:hypothetical protein
MNLGKAGLDVVGFRYDDNKYCRECFNQLPPEKIKFGNIRRAVIVLCENKQCCCAKINNAANAARI